MGQAKQRGSREDRIKQAQERNTKLEQDIATKFGDKPSHPIHKSHQRYGTQRFATRLIMAGLLNPISTHHRS